MNLHSAKAGAVVNNDKVRIETNREGVQELQSTLVESRDLAVAEDYEIGGDPYNSTGRHVIIKPLADD